MMVTVHLVRKHHRLQTIIFKLIWKKILKKLNLYKMINKGKPLLETHIRILKAN